MSRKKEEEESKLTSILVKEFTSPRKTIKEKIRWISQITKNNK